MSVGDGARDGSLQGLFHNYAGYAQAQTVWLCLRLLLCDFEDDFEFYRHPERKAGNANHQPNRRFLGAKDISKEVRDSVRDLGLIEEVPVGRNEYSQPDDTSHSIE